MVLLPGFHEVPGPLSGPDGLVLDGFPAEVLAEFRLYSLVNQALMWLVIGVTWACLTAWTRASAKDAIEERGAPSAAAGRYRHLTGPLHCRS
jgi:hypothetical protein